MIGAGHMLLLAKRAKENEARRRILREKKRFDLAKLKDSKLNLEEFDFVKLSDEELKKVTEKHLKKNKKARIQSFIKSIILTIIIILVLVLMYFLMF